MKSWAGGGVGDFHACVGLDEAGLHSTHAITRTHCAALAVKSVARTSLEDDALHARKARRRLVLGRMQRATWQVPEAEEGWAAAWRKGGCTALTSKREAATSCHELKRWPAAAAAKVRAHENRRRAPRHVTRRCAPRSAATR